MADALHSSLIERVAGPLVVSDHFSRCTYLYDFPDLRKIVHYTATAVLTGNHSTPDSSFHLMTPFSVVRYFRTTE